MAEDEKTEEFRRLVERMDPESVKLLLELARRMSGEPPADSERETDGDD